jgi:hypothetical protein
MHISCRSALAVATTLVLGTTAVVAPTLSTAAPTAHRTVSMSSAPAHSAPGKYNSKVGGTWRHGVVRGSFVPVRSFTRHHQTWIQGDLTAKLRRTNGTLRATTTRHDVALPLKGRGAHTNAATAQAQAAACKVLHLNLGPLNLNLLGLHVHLNRVILNIAAIPGAGNLLGNLLCAVTHLLDNTSPSLLNILQLSSLLNRLIGRLT